MLEKITQTSSANSEHKHSKIERFSMLSERTIISQSYNHQNSRLSFATVNKFSDLH